MGFIMSIYNGTALSFAVQNSNVNIVKSLLKFQNIDINAGNQFIGTPLCVAAEKGNIEILKLLLSINGVDVNYQCVYLLS